MLEFEKVTAGYGRTSVLHEVSFSLRPGRLTVMLGRNGSGKSTLLACANQELPYQGTIRMNGEDLALLPPRERAKRVAILPQSVPAPCLSVEELAQFGRNPYLDLGRRLSREDKRAVEAALRDADVQQLRNRWVSTLSGGERQRANLAMILAQNTPVIVLDEPTAHMDPCHEAAFLNRLDKLRREQQKTLLVILHDLNLAAAYADDMVVLDGGSVVFAGTTEECLSRRILEETFRVRKFMADEGQIFFSAAQPRDTETGGTEKWL